MRRVIVILVLMSGVTVRSHAQALSNSQNPVPQRSSAQSIPDVEERLRALEQQVRELQAELARIRSGSGAALQPVQQPATTPSPTDVAAAPAGGDAAKPQTLPTYGSTSGRLLNPDLGVIGNFLSAAGESRGGSRYNLLGGATADPDTGIKDAGVSVSRLIPAGRLFMEATGEMFRGDSGTLFQASRRRDFSVIGRLRAYTDLTESTNVEIGGSYARGHNDLGSDFTTQLYGTDVTVRWKPLSRAIYRSFVARSETIWSRREDDGPQGTAFGTFVSGDYQFARRWFTGGRFDWSERARELDVRDRSGSAILTFWPSEFSQVRGQYRRTGYGDQERVANELLFQVLFTIGAHGAHAF